MSESWSEFVASCNQTIRTNPDMNESNTGNAILEPLLSRLGWRIVPDLKKEYRVGNGTGTSRVDYALQVDGEPRVFIELKRLKRDVRAAEEQLTEYMHKEGVDIGVATNGQEYRVYLRLFQDGGPPSIEFVHSYTVNGLADEDCPVTMLSYSNISQKSYKQEFKRELRDKTVLEDFEAKRAEITEELLEVLKSKVGDENKEIYLEEIDRAVERVHSQLRGDSIPDDSANSDAKVGEAVVDSSISEMESPAWLPDRSDSNNTDTTAMLDEIDGGEDDNETDDVPADEIILGESAALDVNASPPVETRSEETLESQKTDADNVGSNGNTLDTGETSKESQNTDSETDNGRFEGIVTPDDTRDSLREGQTETTETEKRGDRRSQRDIEPGVRVVPSDSDNEEDGNERVLEETEPAQMDTIKIEDVLEEGVPDELDRVTPEPTTQVELGLCDITIEELQFMRQVVKGMNHDLESYTLVDSMTSLKYDYDIEESKLIDAGYLKRHTGSRNRIYYTVTSTGQAVCGVTKKHGSAIGSVGDDTPHRVGVAISSAYYGSLAGVHRVEPVAGVNGNENDLVLYDSHDMEIATVEVEAGRVTSDANVSDSEMAGTHDYDGIQDQYWSLRQSLAQSVWVVRNYEIAGTVLRALQNGDDVPFTLPTDVIKSVSDGRMDIKTLNEKYIQPLEDDGVTEIVTFMQLRNHLTNKTDS